MTSENGPTLRRSYDIVIVGATRAGRAVARAARRHGARVAIVDHDPEARLHEEAWDALRTRLLSLWSTMGQRGPSGGATLEAARAIFRDVTTEAAAAPAPADARGEAGTPILPGPAVLDSGHEVVLADGGRLRAERIVLAPPGRSRRPERFFGPRRAATDGPTLLAQARIPRSAVLIDTDWTGCEWAFALACLGCPVVLVDRRARLLRSLDPEYRLAVQESLHAMGVEIVLEEEIVELEEGCHGEVRLVLASGRREIAETLLVLAGETASLDGLGLERTDVELDPHGQVIVDEYGRTTLPSVLGIGPIVDASGLFASMDGHGDTVAANALGESRPLETDLPWVLHAPPQIGVCGLTAEASQMLDLPHRIATHRAGGRGGHGAMASLITDTGSGRLLGAQVAGPGCVEAIHRASELLTRGADVDELRALRFVSGSASECLVRAGERIRTQAVAPLHAVRLGGSAGGSTG